MSKKKIKKKYKDTSLQHKPETVRVLQYEITTEPLLDAEYVKLPMHIQEEIENIHFMVYENPQKAIEKLDLLIESYPNMPKLYNYLTVAHMQLGRTKKVEELIVENYKNSPTYLFAMLNYAELCMRKGDYEKISEIFDNKFDLKLLYPERNRFHLSEVVNFVGTIGYYYARTGDLNVAAVYYDILNQLEPEHEMTRRLERELTTSFLEKGFRKYLSSMSFFRS